MYFQHFFYRRNIVSQYQRKILLVLISFLLFVIPIYGESTFVIQITNTESSPFKYDILKEWGQFGSSPGEFDGISDIATGTDDTIYVSDSNNHRIQVFSKNGSSLRSWGGWKNGTGYEINPGGITVGLNDRVYVPDSGKDVIYLFDSIGSLLQTIIIPENTSVGHFGSKKIAVNQDGTIYVTEPINKIIRKINKTGNLEKDWQIVKTGGIIGSPGPMVTDEDGALYVIDMGSCSIFKYSKDGDLISEWNLAQYTHPNEFHPADIAIGSDGYLYVTGVSRAEILVLNTSGNLVYTGKIPHKMCFFPIIACNSDGGLILGESQTSSITRIQVTPVQSSEKNLHIRKMISPPLKFPTTILLNPDNTMFIADSENDRVIKTDLQGNIIFSIDSSSVPGGRYKNPGGIAIDSSGIIYATNQGYGKIERFSPDGHYLSEIGSHGTNPGQFNRPTGLAFGPDGSLYVADTGNNRIVKLSPNGTVLTIWGKEGVQDTEFREPWGIAVEKEGMVYVTDSQNCRVEVFSPDGTWLNTWGAKGDDPGRFFIPTGIIIDTDGTVYVSDTNNFRIQQFDKNGTFLHEFIPEYIGPYDKPRMYGLIKTPSGFITTSTYTGEIISLEYGNDTGYGNTMVKNKNPVREEEVSLDEQYARFSRSMDEWWNKTWEKLMAL